MNTTKGTTMTKNTKKLVKREFDFVLTTDEYVAKAKRIAEVRTKLDVAQLKFDTQKAEFKSVETEVEEEISELVSVIRAKKEKRTVECQEIHDYDAAKVSWIGPATGEEYGQRDMRPDERQMAIPGTEPAEAPAQ